MNKVLCTACDKEIRKSQNDLDRHWKSHHKDRLEQGERASYKFSAKGSGSMDQFTVKRTNDKDEKNQEKEEDEDVAGEESTKADHVEKESGEEALSERSTNDFETVNSENPPKKLKIDPMDMILKKLNDMERKIDEMKNEKEKTLEENKAKFDYEEEDPAKYVDRMLRECKTIDQLTTVVESIDFKVERNVEDGVDGFYCELCFDGSSPNWKGKIPGAFKLDRSCLEESDKQSINLRHLKEKIKNHMTSKVHKQKKKRESMKKKVDEAKKSREKTVGMNVFRERYQGIKQSKSRIDFEEDMLRAKLNNQDVGNTNHSRKFAKKLDTAIYDEMKANMKEQMNIKLDATDRKRPAGLMMDKMTPNKRTGQMHAVVIPVPENPLSQGFLLPMMLDVPSLPNRSAEGLASKAKEVFNDSGFSDDQLEGIGWDGEYVKKRVKSKLLDVMEKQNLTKEEMEEWVTEIWEPAHQLELVTKDIMKDDTFRWFKDHIQTINDTVAILGIGKGLEQSMEAAEEVGEKFYKLRTLSDTRFSAYFEGSIKNFDKRLNTTIVALRKRTESTDKNVRDKAANLLKRICSKQFSITNLGVHDIYHLLGSISKELQTVEQFPWNIPKIQQKLLEQLILMEKLKLSLNDDTQELDEINQSVWESLGEKIDDILDEKYVSTQNLLTAPSDRTRAACDILSSQSLLTRVENRLTNLVKSLRIHLQQRLNDNPTPDVIQNMGKCLDLEDILNKEETLEVKKEREMSLKKVMNKAKYDIDDQDEILREYDLFKNMFRHMNDPKSENDEVMNRFKHLLFQTHTCHPGCVKLAQKQTARWNVKVCPEKGNILLPRKPKLIKFIHLFCKEPSLYSDIKHFIHLFLRCLVKTHAEDVVESMGNYIEIHADKRRGRMDISDIGKEALIHWNGPPLARADRLGEAALDRVFGVFGVFGRGSWNFITMANKEDSLVTKRLREEEPNLPFFN